MKTHWFIAVALTLPCSLASAESTTVKVQQVSPEGVGTDIGTITLSDSKDGLVLAPNLKGLPPGSHGIHIHQNPSCQPGEKDGKVAAAIGAGAHFDPAQTGKHEGPAGHGHAGDLPPLTVDKDGNCTTAITAPRLHLSEVHNRSVIIHAGGDNFSDTPQPLGGGGARIACGVIG